MRTIKIISEAGATETYRAICENQQATGATPGQALDAIERELAAKGIKQSGTTVAIVQRFMPDELFTVQQQARLKSLMERLQGAVATAVALSEQEQQELEKLVEAEFQAFLERFATIFKEIKPENSSLLSSNFS